MACSESRILANRENAKKSTGPRTIEGKAIARRNALRHGMAGEGVVLLPADEAKLAERQVTWAEDFRPRTASEAYLVSLAALHSVKLDRCSAVESAGADAAAKRAAEAFEPTRRARIAAIEAVIRQCDRLGEELRRTGTLDGEYLRKLIELLGPFEPEDPRRADLVALAFEARPKSAARSTLPPELLAVCKPPTAAPKPASPAPGADPSAIDAAEAGRRASRAVLAGLIAGHRAERVRERDGLRAELGSDEARALAIAAAGIDEGKVGEVARRYESANENGLFRVLGKLERLQAQAMDSLPNEANDRAPAPLIPARCAGNEDRHLEASEPVPISSSAHHLQQIPESLTPLPNEANGHGVAREPGSLPNEPTVRGRDPLVRSRCAGNEDRHLEASEPVPISGSAHHLRHVAETATLLPNEANDLGATRGTCSLPNEPNLPGWASSDGGTISN